MTTPTCFSSSCPDSTRSAARATWSSSAPSSTASRSTSRTRPADMVLEVDLLAVDEGAEEDHVARAAERVESGQLLEKHVGVVIGRKKRFHRVPAHCSTHGDEDVLISVAQHQNRDLPQPRQPVEKLRKPLVGHGVRHALSAVGEIQMC